jgi:hypothetical protein
MGSLDKARASITASTTPPPWAEWPQGHVGNRSAVRDRHRPPEASRPVTRVCSWSPSPWQGSLHAHLVTREREESLSLLWCRDTLRLTVRRQVTVVVAVQHVRVVDHRLPGG